MDANDLHPCSICNMGLMHTGVPLFWKLSINRFGIDMTKARAQAGLEMALGSVAIARVMGAHEDIASPIFDKPVELLVCEQCAVERNLPVAALGELDR